jgi:hypothetical protein
MDIDEENFHVQVFPSIIGVEINAGVSIKDKGGDLMQEHRKQPQSKHKGIRQLELHQRIF